MLVCLLDHRIPQKIIPLGFCQRRLPFYSIAPWGMGEENKQLDMRAWK